MEFYKQVYVHVYTCTCNSRYVNTSRHLHWVGGERRVQRREGQHDFVAAVKDIQHSFYPHTSTVPRCAYQPHLLCMHGGPQSPSAFAL